jgi:arylsulfatase A-like enzyme
MAKETGPNLLLIMTDEMRGDALGVMGHPDVKTPHLDTLAMRGIRFPNAYTACPSCVPARAELHTGLSPSRNGRVGYEDRVAWNFPRTMAGELTKRGYQTHCVGKMHVHPLRNSVGFESVELHDGYLHAYRGNDVPYAENQLVADDYFHWLKTELGADADVTDTGLDCNSWVARPWIYEEKYHPTNWATSRAIDFFRRRDPGRPFFLMVSYVRPHAPYDAPQCYFDMYQDKKLKPPIRGDWDDREALNRNGRIFNSSTGPSDEDMIRAQQIGYYACITHIDHQVGRLLTALHDNGVMRDTVVLFTSDHGELLSDHCLSRKVRAYQGSIRIPMFVSGPREWIGEPGVCEEVVGLRDVMPTFISCAGGEADGLDGKSLIDFARGACARDYMHGEHPSGALSSQFIVTKRDKYVWYSQTGEERYFRLDSDPEETRNAIHDAEYQPRVAALRALLVRELAGREEGYSDGVCLIAGREPKCVLARVLE